MKCNDGVILSCSNYELNLDEINFFKKTNPLGFVLFKRNYKNYEQLKLLIESLKKITLNSNLLIFVDQEGGKVQRFKYGDFLKFPSQSFFGDIYKNDKKKGLDLAYKSSYLMGVELNKVGVNVNFSPVCDLFYEDAHDVIGTRSFGKNPKHVLELSSTFCKGLIDSGIVPVPKHFPGHGRSMFDTHLDSSVVKTTFKELKKTDLVPFNILSDSLMVMLAHIVYSSIDSNVATYSKKIINEILRKDFKFKGLVISDDISMKAISEDLPTKVKKSYDAGCDVVLYCKGDLKEMKSIYPYVKEINQKNFDFFLNRKKNISLKKKNINKFKTELLEYGLLNDTS